MRNIFLLLSLMIPFLGCGSSRPSGQMVEYEYSYRGCMVHPIATYQVVLGASGVQTLNYSKYDGVIHPVVLQEDVLGKIDSIAIAHKLHKLKDHYYPPMRVYDGYSWSIRFAYEKESISSGGNNAHPSSKQREGIKAINDYLETFIPKEEE